MPYKKLSILIVEDDSRTSRLIRSNLEAALDGVRVEIAGSAHRALEICQKFPPALIIWDGMPNERGTCEEYAACVPKQLWPRVLPISADDAILQQAQERGALPGHPKVEDSMHKWVEALVARVKKTLPKPKR